MSVLRYAAPVPKPRTKKQKPRKDVCLDELKPEDFAPISKEKFGDSVRRGALSKAAK